VAASDGDDEGKLVVADVAGNVGFEDKASEADDMGEIGETGMVVLAPPGTKACRKLAISSLGGITGGKRYNLHQLILPDASILPAPRVGVRGGLFNPVLEACLAEWKSREIVGFGFGKE
jgi:hypothetical protein